MRVLSLHHVHFEGLGRLEDIIREGNHHLTCIHLPDAEVLPTPGDFDLLIVMGGPMGVGDVGEHPWLVREKSLIRQAIETGRTVFGICLGAQLIAEVLGGRVFQAPHREIGWFPVFPRTDSGDSAAADGLLETIPESFTPFHWHGDTFTLPPGAVPLWRSEACWQQGFLWSDRVLALQFHLESTPESVSELVRHGSADLAGGGPWVQSASEFLDDRTRFDKISVILRNLWVHLLSMN